jgi:hypothetical protein
MVGTSVLLSRKALPLACKFDPPRPLSPRRSISIGGDHVVSYGLADIPAMAPSYCDAMQPSPYRHHQTRGNMKPG